MQSYLRANMMSLCFNGCSHTKGGSWLSNKKQERYSRLVADHYGVPEKNIAISGDSNDGIVRRSIQYLEENTVDIFIIQFTLSNRCQYIDKKGQLHRVCSYEKDPIERNYYKYFYTRLNGLENAYKNMHLFDLYCKSRKQKYIPFIGEHKYEYDMNYDLIEYLNAKGTKPLSWKNIYKCNPTRLFPTGLFPLESHNHPNAEENKEMAKIVIGKVDEITVF